jgi:hypothetical protein
LAIFSALVILSYDAPSARADAALSPANVSLPELLRRAEKADGRLASGAYRIVLQRTADGETTTQETYFDGDGYKTTETLADVVTSWGEDGGRKWYRNANGFVQVVSGAFAEHDPLENAASDMTAPASGASLAGVTSDGPPEYVVKVVPREGLSETRYYDTSTYLLQRIDDTEYDGHTRSVTYGDYRRVSGRMVAWSRTFSGDYYKGTRSYEVVSYAPVPKSSVNLAIPQSMPLFDLQGRASATIPADFTPDGIIVRLNVGQRGLDLILDSGSSSIVLSASAASDLGLPQHDKHVESFGGLYTTSQSRVADVSVGGLHAPSVVIDVAPVDESIAPTQRIVGLLGCDFIASGALEVDFTHSTLTFFARAPADLAAQGWTEVPISTDDCVPLVKASFSGAPGQFIIDTGAYSSVLYDHYFAQFKNDITPAKGDPRVDTGSFIGGDEVRLQEYSMRTFGIGNLLFADATVAVPLTKKVQDSGYDGLIGRSTLSSFSVLFDYQHQRVYLKPASS